MNTNWSAVIPVKRLDKAKTRLYDAVPAVGHQELVLALVSDTVAAALAASSVARVIVVSDDPTAAAALAELGAIVVPDEPDDGLNPALRYGAARAAAIAGSDGVVVLASDLAALRPDELDAALAAAATHGRGFVPDAAGTGTAALTARPGVELDPLFGPDSAYLHARSGAVPLEGPWPSLRRDVDTAADLDDAATSLGLGPRTSALLSVPRPR